MTTTTGGAAGAGQTAGSAVVAPNLPVGGGAIRGIDESFTANPATGSASFSVTLPISAGRSGSTPDLSLSYDSGSGNGPFGLGWSFNLQTIARRLDRHLPLYDDATPDVFVLSGQDDLVPVLEPDNTGAWQHTTVARDEYDVDAYRPRVEGFFGRVERWVRRADGDTYWRAITVDNVTTVFGRTPESRISDPVDPSRVFSWLACACYDALGNAMVYEYLAEDSANVESAAHENHRTDATRAANRYLARVRYGNRVPNRDEQGAPTEPALLTDWMFSLVLDYGDHDVRAVPDVDGQQFVSVTDARSLPDSWPVRQDPFSTYRPGFEVRTYRLCRRVLMFHHFPDELGRDDYLARSLLLTYDENPTASFLTQVTEFGHVLRPTASDADRYLTRALPPVDFGYSEVPDAATLAAQPLEAVTGPGAASAVAAMLDPGTIWVDLDGEGSTGLLSETDGGLFYRRNTSAVGRVARFTSPTLLADRPGRALAGDRGRFVDLDGDGVADLAYLSGNTPGYHRRTEDGWDDFQTFESSPTVDVDDRQLRWIDLDGDGLSDLLLTDDDVFTWYPSRGVAGFGPAVRRVQAVDEDDGPRAVFGDDVQTIFIADVSGDGLSDLVRIRNGDVCYWPNLGHGRFGAKVTMDHAPVLDQPDRFDPARIRLADIDGSGTADLVYAGAGGVVIHRNQSGNAWSDAVAVPQLPRVERPEAVQVVDLLGTGTVRVVASSRRPDLGEQAVRYVDLMAGQKPHLLTRTANGLGVETTLEYAPSTTFAVADAEAGRPWVTTLPFPVHVVERVVTRDLVSDNVFVTRYAYHHGSFDGTEREFRGFAMVERFDTEDFAALASDGRLTGANVDAATQVPPTVTRTWFHTGVFVGSDHVSDYFAGLGDASDRGEYYREPGTRDDDAAAAALLLPDTVLPPGMTADEARQACRALENAVLREEIYALDASASADDPLGSPYVVTEHNYGIERLQPAAGDVPGVFLRHRRETLASVYDRTPNDPRVAHNLVLDVDPATGLARKEAAIAYGRRATVRVVAADGSVSTIANPGLEALDPVDRAVQTRVQITWTEHRYATPVNEPDDHRVDMLAESTMWELTGFRPADGASRFSFSELTDDDFAAFTDAEVIAAEDTADPATRQRRVVQQSRTLYRAEDLTGLAPLGEAGPRALPGPTYRLALNPGLVAAVFVRADPVPPAEQLLPDPGSVLEGRAEDTGGYVAMDGAWWVPSEQVFYDPAADPDDPATTAAQELATARDHFFVPRVSVDPFGQRTVVDHDRHDLFVVRSVDALDNTVLVDHDYRVLEPVEVTDANRNRTAVVHDALGMVVARALEGKDNDAIGDRLDGIEPDPTPAVVRALLTDPLTQAAALLGPATQRFVYDIARFARSGQPAVSVTLSRELHLHQEDGTPSPVRVRLSFSDGFGREVQVKSEAQPGLAPQRDPPTSSPAGDVIPGALVRDANGNPTFAPTTPRWVGTGRVVLNNKGKPVRRFDPFFSSTHLFETEPEVTEIGVSAVLFYDPVERVVATIRPDHVYEKVVFSPWRQATYDANDTVAPRGDQTGDPRTDPDVGAVVAGYFAAQDPGWSTWYEQRVNGQLGAAEQRAAVQAEVHADTPAFAHLDALGRPFATIGENRFVLDGNVVEQQHRTTVVWDIRGNQRSVLDGDNRVVMVYDYDLDGHRLHQSSVDSGEVWFLDDAAGRTIRSWDSRRLDRRLTYDALRRPTGVRVTDHGVEREAERIVYGEPAGDTDNLRLQIQQVFDSAGTLTQASYDFKGNAVDTRRNLLADYTLDVDWALDPPLDDAGFRVQRSFDALDRPLTVVSPDASVDQPSFDEGGLLETVTVRLRGAIEPTPFVTAVDYDARGQRLRVAFGNGAETTSSYDPLTSRLATLRTTRPTGPDATASQLFTDPTVVQDLRYTYDPAGNITRIEDAALPTVVQAGQVVEPVRTYTYDAAYRVIEATGREHIGQNQLDLGAAAGSRRDFPFAGAHPNDLQAMRNYTERYEYDDVGNLTQLRHLVDGNGWNRQYEYGVSPLQADHSSNRLTRTTVANGAAVAEDYRYADDDGNDVAGCITAINAMGFAWDHKRRLARADLGGGGTAHIRYDIADQRVRKVVESSAGVQRAERIWFEGFEISREYGAPGDQVVTERETLHVFANDERVALLETQTIDGGAPAASPQTLSRYQVADHLDSATVELDGTGALIALEEYHPYGTSSFQAGRNATEVNLRRYRFTGKERDEETGLSYYGARYYASWLGRWCSPDPLGIVDGTNGYVHARNNPLVYLDTAGTDVKKVVKTDNFHELLRQAISEVEKKTITKEAADKQWAKYAKSSALGSVISAATDPIAKKFQDKVQLLGRVTTKLEGFSPPGWEEAHGNPEACFKLACAGVDQTNPPGETSTGGGGVILYRAEKQRIKTEPTASQVALEQIRRHVDAGRAVVAGVNEPANSHVVDPIKQPVTDHFVAIYGYETDSTGTITALFAKDNAVGGTAEVKFDVAANGAIGKPEEPKRPSVLSEEYQLSEVRFHSGFEYTGPLRPLTDAKELMFWPKPPDPPDPKKKK